MNSRLSSEVSKSQLEKHTVAVNTTDRMILNGRKCLSEEVHMLSLSLKDHLHRKLQCSLRH